MQAGIAAADQPVRVCMPFTEDEDTDNAAKSQCESRLNSARPDDIDSFVCNYGGSEDECMQVSGCSWACHLVCPWFAVCPWILEMIRHFLLRRGLRTMKMKSQHSEVGEVLQATLHFDGPRNWDIDCVCGGTVWWPLRGADLWFVGRLVCCTLRRGFGPGHAGLLGRQWAHSWYSF